jgi:cytoskeletal protein RodZ
MFEIGDSLREARIRRGISLKEAEDATKIRAKYLQALEDDDFEVIPGPTFVKGFLRTYAEFLGMDATLLVDEYRSRFEPHQEPHYVARRPSARPAGRGPRRQSNLLMVGIVALAVLVLLYWATRGRGEETAILDPAEFEPSTTTTVLTLTAVEDTTAVTIESASEGADETGTTLPEGVLALQINAANGRCWLMVKAGSADGKVLYSGTVEKGDSVSLQDAESYWANIGSPSSVELVLNGVPAEVPEPYGNFLVTAAGLERVP